MENNLNDIMKQIKSVQNGVNEMIVPMLKDTINDYKKTFNKMVIIIILLIISLLGISGISLGLIYKQSNEYKDFLNQFDFEGQAIYQDIDAGDSSNSAINDGIVVNPQ